MASEPENKKKGTGDSPREPTNVSREETIEESRSGRSGRRGRRGEQLEKGREIGVHELTHGIQ